MGNSYGGRGRGSVQPSLLPQRFHLAARQFHHREWPCQVRSEENGRTGAARLAGFEQRGRTAATAGVVLWPEEAPNRRADPLSGRLLAAILGGRSPFLDPGRLPRNLSAC